MALETATYISSLVATNPTGSDSKSTADDHLRLIKSTLLETFPNITGAVTPTHTQLNKIGVTATVGDNSTDPASTAFVMTAIAAVNAQTALVAAVTSTANPTLAAGTVNDLTYGSANTPKLPATATNGDTVYLRFSNGLYTNVVARNGLTIMGLSEDMNDIPPYVYVGFKYINSTWELF